MSGKAIAFIAALAVIVLLIVFLPGGEEPPEPQRARQMQQPSQQQPARVAHAPAPEIDSIRIAVRDSTGADIGELTLAPGVVKKLAGTPWALRMDKFYTHLILEENNKPVNASPLPHNPAARIEILRGGDVVDYTWSFEKVPYFRMMGMGGGDAVEQTGLAFALLAYHGLEAPDTTANSP
ncbi:MAG: hypothetical protein MAG453_01027 [Calditrichaeota bacterium]|nr:hypothetical protein [Calditrichota bacterium]